MSEFGEEKTEGKSAGSSQAMPPTEQEKDTLTHLDTIKSLRQDIDFLESVRKVTKDEPSRESLGRSVETLQRAQGRLYRSLYDRYGIDAKEADKIIDTQKSEADKLAALRERVAMQGYEAIKKFENSGQFDTGVLKDLTNRAITVQGTPEPPQAPQNQTEQEKIVANLLELSNQEKKINQQLANAQKTLTPEEIRELKQTRAQIRQEYKEKFAEIVKRPDREQIIKRWENAVKLELKTEREARRQEKTPARTK
jgi:hypothetical protein